MHVTVATTLEAMRGRLVGLLLDYAQWPRIFPATIARTELVRRDARSMVVMVHHRREGRVVNVLTDCGDGVVVLREFKPRYVATFVNRFDPVPGGTRYTVDAAVRTEQPRRRACHPAVHHRAAARRGRRADITRLSLSRRLGFIGEHGADQPSRRRESMQLVLLCIEYVNHREAEHDEHVGDETTVTAPPENLGAHHCRTLSACQHEELEQPVGEFLGRQMVGVGPECWMPPSGIS